MHTYLYAHKYAYTSLLSARIQFKILVMVLKSKLGVTPKYLMGHVYSHQKNWSSKTRTFIRKIVFF